jgi:hypothetical protein
LSRADPPTKESYQLSKQIRKFQKINSEPEQTKEPYPLTTTTKTMMMMMMMMMMTVMI